MANIGETDEAQAPGTGERGKSLSAAKGVAVLAGITVAVIALVAIGAALGLSALYGGFLFAFYWTGLRHADQRQFWPALVGALAGIVTIWLLEALPAALGAPLGIALWIGLLLAAVYARIMGWLPLLVNDAMMLFLTVGGIPAVRDGATLSQMARAVVVAAAYVGVLVLIGRKLADRASNNTAVGPSA